MTPKEQFQELWDDDKVFERFIEEWMKKHRDTVYELVEAYLDKRIGSKTWSDEADEYAEFIEAVMEQKYADAVDAAYEAQREIEMWEEEENKKTKETK